MVCVLVTRQRASITSSFRARGWNNNWAQKLHWRNRKIVGRMREATCIFIHAKEYTLCKVANKKDLSTDQLYLMEICEAINCGHYRESLSNRNPGRVCHSR
ncbi:hypothetical protein AVEN_234711-1 [Araneus ventricosus]|uniref:Uncharacterized protein n=1 Tax=Araneus ventricosus TaxID=182803 RepID=A0A4Y2IIA3_ARAVE|nr:hypothetical protein AVEN_234711-1 [Araneus ventricosus]